MADKVITITTPIGTTTGTAIHLLQTASGSFIMTVTYDPAIGPQQVANYSAADVAAAPTALRNAITSLFTNVMPNAATKMGF